MLAPHNQNLCYSFFYYKSVIICGLLHKVDTFVGYCNKVFAV